MKTWINISIIFLIVGSGCSSNDKQSECNARSTGRAEQIDDSIHYSAPDIITYYRSKFPELPENIIASIRIKDNIVMDSLNVSLMKITSAADAPDLVVVNDLVAKKFYELKISLLPKTTTREEIGLFWGGTHPFYYNFDLLEFEKFLNECSALKKHDLEYKELATIVGFYFKGNDSFTEIKDNRTLEAAFEKLTKSSMINGAEIIPDGRRVRQLKKYLLKQIKECQGIIFCSNDILVFLKCVHNEMGQYKIGQLIVTPYMFLPLSQ